MGRTLTTIGKSTLQGEEYRSFLGRRRIGGEQWGGGGRGERGGRGMGRVREATSPGPRLKVKVDYWANFSIWSASQAPVRSISLFVLFELYLDSKRCISSLGNVFVQKVWYGRDKFTGGKSCISTKYLHFPINIEVVKLPKSSKLLSPWKRLSCTLAISIDIRPDTKNISETDQWARMCPCHLFVRSKQYCKEKRQMLVLLRITWTVTDLRSPTLGWQL